MVWLRLARSTAEWLFTVCTPVLMSSSPRQGTFQYILLQPFSPSKGSRLEVRFFGHSGKVLPRFLFGPLERGWISLSSNIVQSCGLCVIFRMRQRVALNVLQLLRNQDRFWITSAQLNQLCDCVHLGRRELLEQVPSRESSLLQGVWTSLYPVSAIPAFSAKRSFHWKIESSPQRVI